MLNDPVFRLVTVIAAMAGSALGLIAYAVITTVAAKHRSWGWLAASLTGLVSVTLIGALWIPGLINWPVPVINPQVIADFLAVVIPVIIGVPAALLFLAWRNSDGGIPTVDDLTAVIERLTE